MNFLKNLFSKNGSGMITDVAEPGPDDNLINKGFEKLFKEDNPPGETSETGKNNFLKDFFDINFSGKGYEAGYEFHTTQSLEKGQDNIISEYRHLLGIFIDEKENEIYLLEIHKIQTEEISDGISRQLDLRIKKLKENIEKLNDEMNLSAGGKGHIKFPLNKYKAGFENGMTQYFNERFFAQSTGLFN